MPTEILLDLSIPISGELQAQGDLIVVPLKELSDQVRVPATATWREVPPEGVELLRGAGGNTHTLVADPDSCLYTADVEDVAGLAIGVFEALAPVYLLHREHGGTGVAAGIYVVRRQREHVLVVRRPMWTRPRHRDVPRGLREVGVGQPVTTSSVRLVAD
jgi:hypothetical protein